MAVSAATKVASSPELRAIGKDLANQGKAIAHQAINNKLNEAANKLAKETGVKVDTKLLKNSINKHLGAGKKRK